MPFTVVCKAWAQDCLKAMNRLCSSSTGESLLFAATMIKSCLPDFQGDRRGWLCSRQSNVPPQPAATEAHLTSLLQQHHTSCHSHVSVRRSHPARQGEVML